MILITGATGRIGNVLVKNLLSQGQKVKILARKTSNLLPLKNYKIDISYGDILDSSSLENALINCEYVYHLAGYINISNKNKNLTFNTNIEGTKNVLKACEQANIKKLLYTSSIHAFQAPKDGSIIDENTKLCDEDASRGVYDQSKALATKQVLNSKLNTVIVAPTGVIGPYDFRPSFFGKGMIDSISNKLKTSVPGAYDYVDVRDVVQGIISAMNMGKNKNIYILGGQKIRMREYFSLLRKFTKIKGITKTLKFESAMLLGKFLNFFSNTSSITPYSLETLMSNCNISHSKAERELGFKPRQIEKSLYDQYLWFKDNNYF